FADGGEGEAVAEEQGDVAGARAGGGEGVAVHGGVGVGDGGEGGRPDVDGAGGVGDVGAGLGRVFDEGLDLGGEAVDGAAPGVGVGVVVADDGLERSEVGGAEGVEVEVIFAGDFVHELADEDESADGAEGGV